MSNLNQRRFSDLPPFFFHYNTPFGGADWDEICLIKDDEIYQLFYPHTFRPRNRFAPVDEYTSMHGGIIYGTALDWIRRKLWGDGHTDDFANKLIKK